MDPIWTPFSFIFDHPSHAKSVNPPGGNFAPPKNHWFFNILSLDPSKHNGFFNILSLEHLSGHPGSELGPTPHKHTTPTPLGPTRTIYKPYVFHNFATWPSLWTLCSLYQIPTHTSGCLQMPPDAFRYLQIPSDASRYLQIPPNICRCLHVPPDTSRYLPPQK